MKNFVQHGDVLHYKVQPSDVIKSGDMVAVRKVVGIAVTDGVPGELLAVSVRGVYSVPLPAASGEIKQGDALYFNATAKEITLTAGTNPQAGFAWDDAVTGTFVSVKLLG